VIRLMRAAEMGHYELKPSIDHGCRSGSGGAVVQMRGGPGRGRGTAGRRMLAALGAGVAVLVMVGACSSSTSSGSTSSSASTSPSSSASPSASASPSSSTAGDQPADPAAAKAAITKTWETFFNAKTSTSERVKLLQNGQVLAPAIGALNASPQARAVSSTVTSVTFLSATTAKVGYNLAVSGRVVLPNATGDAVLDNGTWKVGTRSLCSLLALLDSGKAIPGC
jgi:hypothetical protein